MKNRHITFLFWYFSSFVVLKKATAINLKPKWMGEQHENEEVIHNDNHLRWWWWHLLLSGKSKISYRGIVSIRGWPLCNCNLLTISLCWEAVENNPTTHWKTGEDCCWLWHGNRLRQKQNSCQQMDDRSLWVAMTVDATVGGVVVYPIGVNRHQSAGQYRSRSYSSRVAKTAKTHGP